MFQNDCIKASLEANDLVLFCFGTTEIRETLYSVSCICSNLKCLVFGQQYGDLCPNGFSIDINMRARTYASGDFSED